MAKKRDLEGRRLHHFELSDTNRTVRWVLIIILLAVAAVSITIGLLHVLQTPAGWQTVKGNSTALNCGDSFTFHYNYGAGDQSPTTESKALEPLYGKIVEDAWKIFYPEAGKTDVNGIYELNQHPNEQIAVDPGLYAALVQMVESGSRALYLAPVYTEYDILLRSENDSAAQAYDPARNADQKAYVQLLADFAGDPESVSLALNGDNKVTLQVSQEYLDFAKTGWKKGSCVTVIPFLTGSGRHLTEDIAGDMPGTVSALLEGAGYQAKICRKGLLEISSVREMWVDKHGGLSII
jgi:hypothetical protein